MYSTFSAVAAALVVLFGTVVAPDRKPWVPWSLYGIGTAFALWMAVMLAIPSAETFENEAVVGRDFAIEQRWRRLGRSVFPGASSLTVGAVVAWACARRSARRGE